MKDAVVANDVARVQELAAAHPEVLHATIRRWGRDGVTPLHVAGGWGKLEAAEALLELGAFVDARQSNGSTPLHYAAYNGHLPVVQALVERGGADLAAKANNGITPLGGAQLMRKAEVAAYLRGKGAPAK